MRPLPRQLSATTTEQTHQVGPGMKALMIKNTGNNDVYVDFDNAIDTSNSYLLEAGETLTLEFGFIDFHYKAVTGTSTLHIIKIIQ